LLRCLFGKMPYRPNHTATRARWPISPCGRPGYTFDSTALFGVLFFLRRGGRVDYELPAGDDAGQASLTGVATCEGDTLFFPQL
jgi:hypothetical protein